MRLVRGLKALVIALLDVFWLQKFGVSEHFDELGRFK
jgi:hypothetical protein